MVDYKGERIHLDLGVEVDLTLGSSEALVGALPLGEYGLDLKTDIVEGKHSSDFLDRLHEIEARALRYLEKSVND